eukprot:2784322-Heterocapsa_arctica.AAC.1
MPTTDMETRIHLEELGTETELAKCTVPCHSGKLNWTFCNLSDCYRCNLLQKAVGNCEIVEHKGDTIKAIGKWRQEILDRSLYKREDIVFVIFPGDPAQR